VVMNGLKIKTRSWG